MHLPSDNILSFLWQLLPCEALRFMNTQVSLRSRSAHHAGRKGQPACSLGENQKKLQASVHFWMSGLQSKMDQRVSASSVKVSPVG